MLTNTLSLPFCVGFRTGEIFSSKIRYYDLLILIPNLIFLLFLLIKWIQTRAKLNFNKPLLLSVTCLLFTITLTNIFRCLFVIIFPDQAFHAQEIIVKILWLASRFVLLWTELSILLFGICFGRSNRQSLEIIKILTLSFISTSIYTAGEAVLEFRQDTRPIKYQSSNYNLYAHGGMKFLLISSSIFFTMYVLNFFLPCLCHRHDRYLPIRRSFYSYCFVMALINLLEMIGTILNITDTTFASICLVDGTTWIFYICFAPFVYHQFLRRALSSQVLIPQIIYADSTINDGEDDDLIDPGLKTLIDRSTNERLDGQFEDITASTKIIEPIL